MDDVNRENLARMIAQQKAALAAMEAVMGMDQRPDPGSITTTGQPNPLFRLAPPGAPAPSFDGSEFAAPAQPQTAEERITEWMKAMPEFPEIRSVGKHASSTTIVDPPAAASYIEVPAPLDITKWREILFRPGMAAAMLYVLMPVAEEIVARLDVDHGGDIVPVIRQLESWINLTVAQRVALTELFQWVEGQLDSPMSVIPRTILSNMAAAAGDYDTGLE